MWIFHSNICKECKEYPSRERLNPHVFQDIPRNCPENIPLRLLWVYLEQEMFIQISVGWMSTWINVKTPFLVGKSEVTEGSSSPHYLIYDFYCRSKSNDMKNGVKIRYIKSSKTICNAWYHNKLGVYLNVRTERKVESYKSKWSFLLMDRRAGFCFLFVLIFKGIWAVNSISQIKFPSSCSIKISKCLPRIQAEPWVSASDGQITAIIMMVY